jgi:hypothetical protein
MLVCHYYGKLLLNLPQRKSEATRFLKLGEEMSKQVPFWYDKMEMVIMPEIQIS